MITIENIFVRMRVRPTIYLRSNHKVEILSLFVDGFFCEKKLFAELTDFEKVFKQEFGNFVRDKYNVSIGTEDVSPQELKNNKMKNWDYVIAVNSKDEKGSLDLFFELYDEFHKMYDNGDFAGVLRE